MSNLNSMSNLMNEFKKIIDAQIKFNEEIIQRNENLRRSRNVKSRKRAYRPSKNKKAGKKAKKKTETLGLRTFIVKPCLNNS